MESEFVARPTYYFAMIFNVITLLVLPFYVGSLSGLNFKRTRSLTEPDFSIYTNEYTSVKYYFIYPVPLISIICVMVLLFVRLIQMELLDIVGDNDDTEKKRKIDFQVNFIRGIHITASTIAIIAMIISLVFLIIDYTNCNAVGINGAQSLCTDVMYCCSGVITVPGIIPGCPWVQSCTGIIPPVTIGSLTKDPYFLQTFIITICLLIFAGIHFAFSTCMDTLECGDDVREDDVKNPNKTPIASRLTNFGLPSMIIGSNKYDRL